MFILNYVCRNVLVYVRQRQRDNKITKSNTEQEKWGKEERMHKYIFRDSIKTVFGHKNKIVIKIVAVWVIVSP